MEMNLTKKLLSAFLLCICTSISYADIEVVNNTDLPATASMALTPCSSVLGLVLKPHETRTASTEKIREICGDSSCKANVYMNENCSGKKVATVKANADDGVLSIQNFDNNQVVLSGDAEHVIINPLS